MTEQERKAAAYLCAALITGRRFLAHDEHHDQLRIVLGYLQRTTGGEAGLSELAHFQALKMQLRTDLTRTKALP